MTNEDEVLNAALAVPTCNLGAESVSVDEIIRRRREATPKGEVKAVLWHV